VSRQSDARAWRSLVIAAHVLEEALDRQSQRDGGMPHAYYKLLVLLYETPGHSLPARELADRLRYSPSRLTHAVTSMEKSGWLTRSRSADDRRVQIIALTDAGTRLVRRVSPLQAVGVRAVALSRLTDEQVQQLEAIGSEIVAALDARQE
jgi:DNA-binding MarR family transcriptional regulator